MYGSILKEALGPAAASKLYKAPGLLQKILGWGALAGVGMYGANAIAKKMIPEYRHKVNTSQYNLYDRESGYTNPLQQPGDEAITNYLKHNIAHDPNGKMTNARWASNYLTPGERRSMDAYGRPRHTWDKNTWNKQQGLMKNLDQSKVYDVEQARKKLKGGAFS